MVNPQPMSRFLDLHFDGGSAIYGRSGILAEATTIDRQEVVHARVTI